MLAAMRAFAILAGAIALHACSTQPRPATQREIAGRYNGVGVTDPGAVRIPLKLTFRGDRSFIGNLAIGPGGYPGSRGRW